MSTTSLSYDPTGRPVANHEAQNAGLVSDILSDDELYQRSFLADSYPLVSICDLDPWIMGQFGWRGDTASISAGEFQQYIQPWEGTCFDNDTQTYKESSPTRYGPSTGSTEIQTNHADRGS